ncbi:unnamed protein product [Phytophthora lilii]|uniref:Unnamed protein product n=1 Tax=Phytophthora lilii TaxID=2077276 RepID=A0A9W6WK58_9STRA|nr:unnamed protein product [Phytophthora lilii]
MLSLPDDMFDDMGSLTFIHFASFIPTTRLPSFDGLTNLRSLTLAVFLKLEELPSFDHLHNLERLVISSIPKLHALPDFEPIRDLKAFTAVDRGEWCCNGFLGNCNLKNPLCQPHEVWGFPAAACLAGNITQNIASKATIEIVSKFNATICGPVLQLDKIDGSPTEERVRLCNGALWKQCNRPEEAEAMCYNEQLLAQSFSY